LLYSSAQFGLPLPLLLLLLPLKAAAIALLLVPPFSTLNLRLCE
jgi:hypothetical protein